MSPIKLTIEISGPLDPDDRDLLSGVAVMTLAIANHEMAKNAFPETFSDEDDQPPPPDERSQHLPAARPCGALDETRAGYVCLTRAGHRGRHSYRRVPGAVS
jgi:hypothetical protein